MSKKAFHEANDLEQFLQIQIETKRSAERLRNVAVFCFCIGAVGVGSYFATPTASETKKAYATSNATPVKYEKEKQHNVSFWGNKADVKKELSIKYKKVAAYVARFSKTAKAEEAKFGIPAAITLAQGILESRQGESGLAVKGNNHFGIKCFSSSCKKGHCMNFSDDTHKDFFKKYESPWQSFRDHSLLLKRKHYKSLFKSKKIEDWAKGLKRLGYATEPRYAEMLLQIIEEHNLRDL